MMLYKTTVITKLKPEYPDNHGKAIEGALRAHGFTDVAVKQGRIIELEIESDPTEIEATVEQMAIRLLAHPVTDSHEIKIHALPGTKYTFDIKTLIQAYDLSDQGFRFGKFHIVRVEWKEQLPHMGLLRYTKNGKLEELGVRMDLDKMVILDDLSVKRSDQAMKKRARLIWQAATDGMRLAGVLPELPPGTP